MASPPALQEERVGSWASYATILTNICLLRRKLQGRKVGSHNRISGKPTCLDADHHTSSRRVYAIGRMARSMSGPDRTHFHVTGGPDDLRLVLRIECDHTGQIGRAARETRVVLGAALGDFAGLEE